MEVQCSYLDQEGVPLVVELHPDLEELQEDILRGLVPLDKPISTKEHHVACICTLFLLHGKP